MKAYNVLKSDLEVLSSSSIDTYDIIYPSCDSEFVLDKKLYNKLINQVHNRTIVSVSTKAVLSTKMLDNLSLLDEKLKDNNGFLKLSVSITNKHSIDKLEPRTANYTERLNSLQILSNSNIATSVNIKPILPVIPLAEYIEIIDDCSEYTDLFLLGGLYVDKSESKPELLQDSKTITSELRYVSWLPGKTKWPYIEDKEKINSIVSHIEKIDKNWFDSDIDVLKHIFAGYNKKNG